MLRVFEPLDWRYHPSIQQVSWPEGAVALILILLLVVGGFSWIGNSLDEQD